VQALALFNVFKVVGLVVLVLMAAAICYAGIIGISYWSGIGV